MSIRQLIRDVGQYTNPSRIEQDVAAILNSNHVASLTPRLGHLTHTSGARHTMLQLAGVLFMNYQGQRYNVPMSIFFPSNYPTEPPVCFVTPTQTMLITPNHPVVNDAGFILIHNIAPWNPNMRVLVLLEMIAAAFSRKPPCYARPAGGAALQRRATSDSAPSSLETSANGRSSSFSGRGSEKDSFAANEMDRSSSASSEPVRSRGHSASDASDISARRKAEAVAIVRRKLLAETREYFENAMPEVEKALAMQKELEENKACVARAMEAANTLLRSHEEAAKDLESQVAGLREWLESNERVDEVATADLLVPRDVVSGQLIDLVAEDHAIEDALYLLEQQLSRGLVSLEVFLKTVRRLSREQFFVRALAKKINEKRALMSPAPA